MDDKDELERLGEKEFVGKKGGGDYVIFSLPFSSTFFRSVGGWRQAWLTG